MFTATFSLSNIANANANSTATTAGHAVWWRLSAGDCADATVRCLIGGLIGPESLQLFGPIWTESPRGEGVGLEKEEFVCSHILIL